MELIRNRDKENPIMGAEIAGLLDVDIRLVRQVVRQLVIDHHLPIGSVSAGRSGYYWITDIRDIEQNYQRLRRRGIRILQRAQVLRKLIQEMNNQMRLTDENAD